MILGMLWLVCHSSEIDWKTREMRIMGCPKEYCKQ